MATVPPAGGNVAPPGGAAAPPAGPATNFGLGGSATIINARAMGTDNWRQRRIKPRSVNSFMAFRSFYSHIFKMQQKFTSAHVKHLWEKDIFKDKWVIIAKAFSTIRSDLGVIDASLDKFLAIICPAIGIIPASEYLEKMKWEIVTTPNGTAGLQQTSTPDFSSFEENLAFTTVGEWDLIALAIANHYVTPGTALQNAPLAQNGVFSAATAPQQPQPAQQPQPVQQPQLVQQPQTIQQPQTVPQTFTSRVDFFRSVATNPIATASAVLGFDVRDMLRVSDNQPLEWTGSLADLYHPETGFYDIERAIDDPFIVGNINEPLGFDTVFNDSIRNGYSIPAVPDFDGEEPDYL